MNCLALVCVVALGGGAALANPTPDQVERDIEAAFGAVEPRAQAVPTPAPFAPVPEEALSQAQRALVQSVNSAGPGSVAAKGLDAATLRLQVLLDRALFSPGALDGLRGRNSTAAVRAYASAHGLGNGGAATSEVWARLTADDPAPALAGYIVSEADVMAASADPSRHPYGTLAEALAERFHMDEALLRRLNPGARFTVGEAVIVAAPGSRTLAAGSIARMIIDRGTGTVQAYDPTGRLVAHAPATVGSKQTPAPRGALRVDAVAAPPGPEGPNNPAGGVFIALSGAAYAITGSASPAAIGRAAETGQVQLTNWTANALAAGLSPGTPVEFTG